MTDVDFTVTHLWDLTSKFHITGQLTTGEINPGDVLVDSKTGARVRVIGIDIHASLRPPECTLVIDRADVAAVRVGQRLVNDKALRNTTSQ
ncbi:hypothetical protein [Nocardia pseudobrasiliensis]|uniref:Uncharacterized protein n=1 Tax=Nocardia pseudobrasiliensis TaxID=45979 RepID=A0A370HKA1_9NOCA|nr:hypothetical protein [Nocardia pseudobrasiliensis]RDI59033.1 hypothetical protein DFR76_12036 [Nocardia pseudobrasiliensis]